MQEHLTLRPITILTFSFVGFSLALNSLDASKRSQTSAVANSASSQQYQVLHQFVAKPIFPYAGLIQGNDGNFYGTTENGGATGAGTIFKITAAGDFTILHSFDGSDGAHPQAGLTQASDGNFYGTTLEQGANNFGTVFRIAPSGIFTTVHQFTGTMGDGANPVAPLVQTSDGTFYGTTYFGGMGNQGTVFKMDLLGNVTTLHSFGGTDGSHPEGAVVQGSDGNFYGTTALGGAGPTNAVNGGNGTVFKMTPSGALTTLYSFAVANGENPLSGLIQGNDGNFYGTTWQGGLATNSSTTTTGNGTIFKITPSGTLSTVHFFAGMPIDGANPQAALVLGKDGNFYGVSETGGMNNSGTVFKMDPSGNVTLLRSFAGASDGSTPLHAPLIQATDGNFYGTAFAGGPFNGGTLFEIDSLGNFTLLHYFGGNDGSQPYAPIVQGRDGNFYGTTYSGGAHGQGIVFKMDSSGNTTILHAFAGSDGANPTNLIQGSDGNFYGTTFDGGGTNNGTVFKMDSAGNITTLHSLTGLPVAGVLPATEGSLPFGALVEGSDGNFYGTTAFGGTSNDGTIFRVTPAGVFTTLHSFSGSDGSNINCALVQGADGNFYGTTTNGGATSSTGGSAGDGTVFKMDASGNLTTLHSFVGSDGSLPVGGLLQAADGNFYGTTDSGGASNNGTIFKMGPSGNVTVLYSFSGDDGTEPVSALIQGTDGNFYSTTFRGGPMNNGTVFSVTPSGTLTTLHSFEGNEGAHPYGGLVQSSDGNLYGATLNGGPSGIGVVFRIGTPLPVQLNSLVSRMVHGSAGIFDVDLPLTGNPGIECRSGGATGNYELAFIFANTLASVDSATVTSGTGTVVSSNIDPTDSHNYIVNLTGVTNAQQITISLTNVTDSVGDFSASIPITFGVLIGDTNGDGLVNSADIGQTKSKSGQAVDQTNFREDVNADGFLNSADIGLVKSKSGTGLP